MLLTFYKKEVYLYLNRYLYQTHKKMDVTMNKFTKVFLAMLFIATASSSLYAIPRSLREQDNSTLGVRYSKTRLFVGSIACAHMAYAALAFSTGNTYSGIFNLIRVLQLWTQI